VSAPTFRTPCPAHRIALTHPELPAPLAGLSILHVTDAHFRRPGQARRLLHWLPRLRADLLLFTGDWMSRAGDEPVALRLLEQAAAAWAGRCDRLGAFGIFGNHDKPAFRRFARNVPGLRWLDDQAADIPGVPLRILGSHWPGDWLAASLSEQALPKPSGAEPPFRIALAHSPSECAAAASLGVDLVLSGHTHGGQIRLPGPFAPVTSSELPPRAPAGLFRFDNTLVAVSRGLGQILLEFRIACAPQLPLYTLARGPLPQPRRSRADLDIIETW